MKEGYPLIQKNLMESLESMFSMNKMHKDNKVFPNFLYVKYATDYCFLQANRPLGVHNEVKKYYSKYHGLYGFKLGASVLPNRICVFAPPHDSGSRSDIEMFRSGLDFHSEALSRF